MTMPTIRTILASTTILALAVTAGCGGDDDDEHPVGGEEPVRLVRDSELARDEDSD